MARKSTSNNTNGLKVTASTADLAIQPGTQKTEVRIEKLPNGIIRKTTYTKKD